MTLKHEAEGRWPGILAALGVPEEYRDTQRNGPCPFCGGTDRYRFTDYRGLGYFVCHTCTPDGGNGFELAQRWLKCDFKQACREVEKVLGMAQPTQQRRNGIGGLVREIWSRSVPIERGDEVCCYLYARGLRHASRVLRKAHVWDKESGKEWLSMIAPIRKDAQLLGIHVTHLQKRDGIWCKAAINAPRKQYKLAGSLVGGYVPLASQDGRLGVAEGIETALAVTELMEMPCWAVIATSLMRRFRPPQGLKKLVIYGDNDASFAGHAAAYHLANRLSRHDIEISVAIPEERGWDWLDVLNARKGSS